ncbi:MAG: oligosaccharide flippase family protein [Acidobacteria bacterium]|nr:oligosaccharide flippase family protein [Acidobacteriota bacterium]
MTPGVRRAVAAGTVTLLSARLVVAGLAMIFIAVSTRLLSLREMAVFAVYSSLCVTQSMICSLGLLTMCTRELPALMGQQDLDGASRLLRTSLLINASVSAVVAVILFAASRPISLLFLKDDAFVPEIRIVAAGVFLWNIFEANQVLQVALQRFRTYGRANVLCAIAQRGASLALFFLMAPSGRGLAGYLLGYAAGTLAGIAVTFASIRDLLARPSGRQSIGPLLRYSVPFYADGYLRYLYTQADQLLVGVFLSPEVFSLYFVAKRFIQYYQQMIASSIDPVLAKVAELRSRGGEAVSRSLRAASRYFILVFLPFSVASAALSGFYLQLAGGDRYRPATLVLALLSLSVAPYAAFNLVTGYVYVLGAPLDRLKHNLVAGLTQLAIMTSLLGAGAAAGAPPITAAAAIAVARVVSLLVGLAYAHRQLSRYLAPAYDVEALAPTFAGSAVLAAAILVPRVFGAPIFSAPIGAAVGAGLFILIVRPAVRDDDLALLGDLLRGRFRPAERLARRVFRRPAAG